jgi:hypothetical protein
MSYMRSQEKKRPVTYNLPQRLVERIEALALVRGTNRSYEASRILELGFDAEQQRQPTRREREEVPA